MLRATDELGVPVAKSGIVLPLAVAIFRVTGPPMNLAVAIYVAHLYGVHLGPAQIAAGIAVAAVTTMGAVGLPGAVSYISSIAPICIAMRSEEHTSELQSLMRISYAVFCLKKKKT